MDTGARDRSAIHHTSRKSLLPQKISRSVVPKTSPVVGVSTSDVKEPDRPISTRSKTITKADATAKNTTLPTLEESAQDFTALSGARISTSMSDNASRGTILARPTVNGALSRKHVTGGQKQKASILADNKIRLQRRNSHQASSSLQRKQGAEQRETRIKKAANPDFSVRQQHFSPEKAIVGVSVPDNTSGTYAGVKIVVTNLQVELLQLHVMHRQAHEVQRQWEESAKRSLGARFADLSGRHAEIKYMMHQQQILLNQLTLAEWCQGTPSSRLAEKVQQLSRNLEQMNALLEPDGKYSHILGVFESWLTRAQSVRAGRMSSGERQQQHWNFVDGIGDGWKAEAMVLERELVYCRRELADFGAVRAASSLGRIISLHQTLITNLLEELDVIQWIESHLINHESAWLEGTVENLAMHIEKSM